MWQAFLACLFHNVYFELTMLRRIKMIYRNFQGESLSMLGFGAMRLPTVNGIEANIDEILAQKMVDEAIANGVNYFDTAWGYHDGNSEWFKQMTSDRFIEGKLSQFVAYCAFRVLSAYIF